ncbi:MAG: hypothetical protein IT292_05495 [Deltaproteobacteria bacterium]|nr:hypothetical protein [Deltaproteobacteria bacterium]
MNRFLLNIFTLISSFLLVNSSLAVVSDTITTKLNINLCPEYKLGNVAMRIRYSIEGNPSQITATIKRQLINSAKTKGIFDIELPGTHRKKLLYINAYCYTYKRSYGLASNQISFTNCDRLKLRDSDRDGLNNALEDSDCSNSFNYGDYSNLYNFDSDNDNVSDKAEYAGKFIPTNAGSSPRPYIFHAASFDPDGDGNSNSLLWRKSSGTWIVKDYPVAGQNSSFLYGKEGDTPITYQPAEGYSDVGVVRIAGKRLRWFLRGSGFAQTDGNINALYFGNWGDILAHCAWEQPNKTNPAVIRLTKKQWHWYIYRHDKTTRNFNFGYAGDRPIVQDYDGDGLCDPAVYRRSTMSLYVVYSSDDSEHVFYLPDKSVNFMVRGDVSGDGLNDISYWNASTGYFRTLTSDNGFNASAFYTADPLYYKELYFGKSSAKRPLPWFRLAGKFIYTLVDHSTGYRYFYPDNNRIYPLLKIKFGKPGDSLG